MKEWLILGLALAGCAKTADVSPARVIEPTPETAPCPEGFFEGPDQFDQFAPSVQEQIQEGQLFSVTVDADKTQIDRYEVKLLPDGKTVCWNLTDTSPLEFDPLSLPSNG